MRIIFFVFLSFCAHLSFAQQGIKTENLANRLILDYAREHLMKEGLSSCVADQVSNKALKRLFSYSGGYYANRIFHNGVNNEQDFTDIRSQLIYLVEIKPFFKKQLDVVINKETNDIDIIEKCLDIYHSEAFRTLIARNDKNINPASFEYYQSNIGVDMAHKLFPYEMLEGEARKLGDWGMFHCLAKVIENSATQYALEQKARKIKETLHYDSSVYETLEGTYAEAVKKYKIAFGENPETHRVNMGCFVFYDSNDLNHQINQY